MIFHTYRSRSYRCQRFPYSFFSLASWFLAMFAASELVSQDLKIGKSGADNLILVTLDGLRREELFGGADLRLMNREAGGVRDVESLKKRFWRETPQERRKALLPFFWTTIVKQGQLIGDPTLGSEAKCINGLYFSYPGYNELLTGKPDAEIDSNAKRDNPNQTILEWIHGQKGFEGSVAAFGSWDVFPFIINSKRSKIPVNSGWMDLKVGDPGRLKMLNRSAREIPRVWPNVRYDLFTYEGVRGYLKRKNPRVIYIAFGETDDWAHDGRYDLYLDSATRTDNYLKQIWEWVQQNPDYKDRTALLISTDHGRGGGREGWKNHGAKLPGSEYIWFAALGKGVASLGNRKSIKVTQSQFAATAASLLGFEFDVTGVAPKIDFR